MRPLRRFLLILTTAAWVCTLAAAIAAEADEEFLPLPGHGAQPPKPPDPIPPQPPRPDQVVPVQKGEWPKELMLGPVRLPQTQPLPAHLPVPGDLGRPFPAPRAAGGHIVFTKHLVKVVSQAGITTPVATPKLYIMDADGANTRPLLLGTPFDVFKEPRWSARYDRLCFTSNYQSGHSACYEDIFVLWADGSRLQRVTGNQLYGPPQRGYAAVTGLIRDNYSKKRLQGPDAGGVVEDLGRPFSRTQVNIAIQGAGPFIYHPDNPKSAELTIIDPLTGLPVKVGDQDKKKREWQYRFFVPRCAAGYVWIRVWVDKWIGNLECVNLRPNVVNDLGSIQLHEANFLAGNGSVSPDGRIVVGIGSQASVEITKEMEEWEPDDEEQPLPRSTVHGGASNLCVYRGADGMILGMFEPTRAAGEAAGDPALSPDGQWIACAWGRFSSENLAVLPVASVLANRPQPRVVVQGRILLPVLGCRHPAWSPDGRLLAFARTVSQAGGLISGNVCVVSPTGADLRQVTHVGLNQLACQPCFSPDGRSLAFTLMTTKHPGPMKIEHLILQQVTVDVFALDLQTGQARQLTTDGCSWEPAWGL